MSDFPRRGPHFSPQNLTADHPLHQMAYFRVVWSCCNIQIWLQKKSSEKVKCMVMWLNICCFPIERHQIRVWAVKVSFDPVNLRTLWLTWIQAQTRAAYNISFHLKPGWCQLAEWAVNGRIQSAKRAHFQAFSPSTPSGKVQFFIGRQPLNRLGSRLFCWAQLIINNVQSLKYLST